MNNMVIVLISLLLISLFLFLFKSEHFDAVGYVYNIPPNWFIKPNYNLNDWIVTVYPDQIQPECLPYSKTDKYGSLENINYMSQAYRFWRF